MMKYLLLSLLFVSCSLGWNNKILSREEISPVLFDIIRADEFANNYIANDSTKNLEEERTKLYERVFALHNTDRETFYRSYKYFLQHPDENKELFDSLANTGRKIRERQESLEIIKEKTNER